ncbi:MAG: apolipoprotein N-acyltransferase [Deltaproteobacteria bacterium]|nr:apolipoprotein N-acyltransferase [Deltaproteobacteria bacterium]
MKDNLSIQAALIALVWGSAFYFLGSQIAAPLGVLAALSLIFLARRSTFSLRRVYWTFFIAHFLGYSWFIPAFQNFAGISFPVALLGFSAFALYGSLQFLLFVWLGRRLAESAARKLSLDVAVSWSFAEVIFFKPFDWYLAHTLTAFPALLQTADLFGAAGVGFLLIWISTLAWDCVALRASESFFKKSARIGALLSLCAVAVCYGAHAFSAYAGREATTHARALLVQSNAAPVPRLTQADARGIAQQYSKLTAAYGVKGLDFVAWPESSVMEPILSFSPAEEEAFRKEVPLPDSLPFLFGTRRIEQHDDLINSVVMLAPGATPRAYDKKISFPLAEGNLLDGILYWLSDPPGNGDFFEIKTAQGPIRALPIICFESTMSGYVASRARSSRAQILIEFSNLNWFSGTRAARQHEVISVWRSIENRLPLLRIINSGPSSLILANGEQTFRIPEGEIHAAPVDIPYLASTSTPYQRLCPFLPWLLALTVAVLLRSEIANGCSRLKSFCRNKTKEITRAKAALLLIVGLLCPIGQYFKLPQIALWGLSSGASPNPFVFNTLEGINYWAHEVSFDLLGKNLTKAHHAISAHTFAQLPGPHLYHMAYAIPFAFAPVYPREYWEPVLQKAFCGSSTSPPTLLSDFNFPDQVASLKLVIKERYPASPEAQPRTWEYRIVCRGKQ